MSITVHKVQSKSDKKAFIQFPHDLYRGDQNYVPELYLGVSEVLSERKNPFFEHSTVDLLLAKKGKEIVGRIACVKDDNYNSFHKSTVGFFGFFDVIDDYEVAKTLLDKAMDFARGHGFDRVLGPMNFTTNDTAGMLVDGYDSPPTVMMTYNKSYYNDFVTRYGFQKEMDMFAYFIPSSEASEKSIRLSNILTKRLEKKGITIRQLNKKKLNQEIKAVKHVYRGAWESNWGFVPPTDGEFDHMVEGLKMVIDERYVYLAEKDGELIGFGAAVPDINEITIGFKNGKLFPFNIFKLLARKKKTKKIRIILLGVLKEYRKLGIEAVFFSNYIQAARENGLEGGEASWVLENNAEMVQAAENLNGKKTKTYRIYSKNV